MRALWFPVLLTLALAGPAHTDEPQPAPTPTPVVTAAPRPLIDLDVRGVAVALHYVQSGWKTPQFAVSEFAVGPIHLGGFYVGGLGLHQIKGFGTAVPLVTYIGQGKVPKLGFLRGVAVTFAWAHEGVFSGKPAYFFGVGVATK